MMKTRVSRGQEDKQMTINCTVSGSFNKHLNLVFDKIKELEKNGIAVLSPKINPTVRKTDDFVYLEGDVGSPREIELMHLDAISRSDFLYVVNPKGYVGKSTLLEIGFELSKGIRIFSSDKVTDTPFNEIVMHAPNISDIRNEIADCLTYLIDLANLANVNLQDAFMEKENINKDRTWGTKKDIQRLTTEE